MSIASLVALVVIAQIALLVVILFAIDAPAIRLANRLLATMLLIIGGSLLLFVWKDTGTTPFPAYYRRVVYGVCFAIGPLLLFYTRALVGPTFRLSVKDGIHFLPVVLVLLLALPALGIYSDPVAGYRVATDDSPHLVRMTSLIGLLSIVWGVAYCLASLRVINSYQRRLLDKFSSIEALSLRWLKRILYLFVAMNAVLAPVLVLRMVVGGEIHPVLYVMLPTSILLLYYVAIAGFRRAQVFYARPDVVPLLSEEPLTAAPEKPKYERSGLDENACHQFWEELRALMEETKPYLDDRLQLAMLAERLGISTHELSQVLSTCAGQNFYDFVNSYRVREVRELMNDPAWADRSLLDIAEQAGFGSKSTFNKYFKKSVGLAPGEYRQQLQEAAAGGASRPA